MIRSMIESWLVRVAESDARRMVSAAEKAVEAALEVRVRVARIEQRLAIIEALTGIDEIEVEWREVD